MRKIWKKTAMALLLVMSMLVPQSVIAKEVQMNLFYNGANHSYDADAIHIMIDGEELETEDMPAVSIDGRTMLPMRVIGEALGCEVLWVEETAQAFIMSDDFSVAFQADIYTALKNNEEFALDVPAMNINDRLMLPVRALTDALDLDLTWVDATRTVEITTSTYVAPSIDSTTSSGATAATDVTTAGIDYPTSSRDEQIYTIYFDKAVEHYEEYILDDTRVIVDFYGVTNALSAQYDDVESSNVTAIRTGQQTIDEELVTRVVLDLEAAAEYSITQNADKKSVSISFETVTLEDIEADNDDDTDYLIIEGDGNFGISVSTETSPYRIIIEIPNVDSELPNSLSTSGLDYITDIEIDKDGSVVTITLELDGSVEYNWTTLNGVVTFAVTKSNLENIEFDSKENALYLYDIDVDVDDITIDDQYLSGYVTITLPENYKDELGYGTMLLGGDELYSAEVQSSTKNTAIRIVQNQYMAYEIEEIDDGCVIYAKNPKDVYDNVVLVDAGHGGYDPGTYGNGLTEKDLNLSVALYVQEYMEDSDIKVYLTRDTDVYVENNTRALIANQIADFMVSIHFNAATGNTTANGTETLYKPSEGVTSSKVLTNDKAADIMQGHLISALGLTNRGLKERDDLLILNATTVPTVLLEICFLTNPGDALKISSTSTQKDVAEAIVEGIEDVMDRYDFR